ncbi:YopX family protein [Lapidilactobacillus gannanensis]|uniref:YopX family protein n=1 Tax=Lapidilactobacillus gannanensis TaxID=2486002 RepID=A0ABW4BL00_9LACO|nr:YopX family protein [Lapidilactobacillus gannanensis]
MRPIKFRAWDNECKVIRDYDELKGLTLDALDASDFKLEQFTGLDDINGKPIYEGDIVQVYRDWIDIVEFRNGSFGLAASMNHSFISFNNLNGEAEVIGNVHDNPELLEDKK